MKNKKILYISQEISPYLADSPMSVLGKAMPVGMQERGYEVRTFMPKYGCINERRNQLHEVIRLSGMNIIIDDTDHPLIIKVATLQPSRMQVYFIDSDDYFSSSAGAQAPLEIDSNPEENDERMIFFVRGVVETVKKLRWEPAVVQCMGWISSLAPLFMKRMMADDPSFAQSKVVYALRNEAFEGTLPESFARLMLDFFPEEDIPELIQDPVDINALHRIGMRYADAILAADADIDPGLLEYARTSGKPFVEYDADHKALASASYDMFETLMDSPEE